MDGEDESALEHFPYSYFMAFLGYTVILLVEKILFDNHHEHKDKQENNYIELEKLNNNDTYKSPEVKLYNINNNFNISLESIVEQPDHKEDKRSKTTKELKSPFPNIKKRNTKISSNVIINNSDWITYY